MPSALILLCAKYYKIFLIFITTGFY